MTEAYLCDAVRTSFGRYGDALSSVQADNLGTSGLSLVTTASYQLHRTGGRFALCKMFIGVSQGIAIEIGRF